METINVRLPGVVHAVTINATLEGEIKLPAARRKPVLRRDGLMYVLGYRSTAGIFFSLGYGFNPEMAYKIYLGNNGPNEFKRFRGDMMPQTVRPRV